MNALPISSFIDDPTDTDLLDATPLLVDLATVADVAETMVANDGYLPRMRYSERGLPMPEAEWS
jgi:TFIIF-interacting CTD phosphatase-like protein